VTSRPRRDFLLDSGGVSALAADRDLLVAYLQLLKLRLSGALLIPIPVLTEVRSQAESESRCKATSDAGLGRSPVPSGAGGHAPAIASGSERVGAGSACGSSSSQAMAPGQVPHTLAWLQKAAVKGVRARTFSAVLAVHERAEVRPTCGMLPVLHVRLRTT
jgi:hypothetical protein